MITWVSLIRDESLIRRKENGNVYDPHAMAIIRGNAAVGHVPQIMWLLWKFLSLPKTSIRARVLSKRVNRGAGCSLEIPVCFVLKDHVKRVE